MRAAAMWSSVSGFLIKAWAVYRRIDTVVPASFALLGGILIGWLLL